MEHADAGADEQAAEQLEAWAVPADMVAARIAAMSDTELQQFANRMQSRRMVTVPECSHWLTA